MKVIRKQKSLEAFTIEEFEKIGIEINPSSKKIDDGPAWNFEFKGYKVNRNEYGDYTFYKNNFIPFYWYKNLILLVDKNNELSVVDKNEFKNEFVTDNNLNFKIKNLKKEIENLSNKSTIIAYGCQGPIELDIKKLKILKEYYNILIEESNSVFFK